MNIEQETGVKVDIPQTELRELSSLTPYYRNSRTHSDEQVKQIAALMIEFGWTNMVLADDQGIVAGHGRCMAAEYLYQNNQQIKFPNGAKIPLGFVPVVDCTGWTPAQRKAYIIADNQSALRAGWDNEMLALEVQDLKALDFDLDLLCFEDDQLDELLESLTSGEGEGAGKDEDEVPEVPEIPVSKVGDVWILGRHRLMCGDSTSASDLGALMNGASVDILFTDPPYGINFKPQRGTHDKILNDNLDGAEFDEFLDAVFTNAKAVMKPDTYAFVWTGWPKIGAFERSLAKLFKLQALHIWVKNNFGIGYYSRPKHEPFYLCLNGKPVYPSMAPADVWEHPKVHSTVHSCEKPVGLITDILDTYHKNSAVLDVFGGSGSTLIACETTGRTAYLMELDPKYVDVIICRYEDLTGKKAVHEETGLTFTDMLQGSEEGEIF